MANKITTYPTKGFNPPIPGSEFTARIREGNGSRAAYGGTPEQAKANLEHDEADRRDSRIRWNDGSTSVIGVDGILKDEVDEPDVDENVYEIRHGDLPRHKEAIMSQLFGEILGWLTEQGITKGEEFETKNQGILQCSRKYIWVDQFHPTKAMTLSFGSIGMDITFGVYIRGSKEILVKKELKNLRYKISTGTDVELIDSHRQKVNYLFVSFKSEFNRLKRQMKEIKNGNDKK